PLDEKCPVCGKNLALKHGRFGEYTACSDYPDCKYIKLKSTGVSCPKSCGGEVVERKSRRGRTFYGCSNYPDCDYTLWNRPLPERCPVCDAPFIVERTTKRTGTVRFCSSETCDYKEKVPKSAVPPAQHSAVSYQQSVSISDASISSFRLHKRVP